MSLKIEKAGDLEEIAKHMTDAVIQRRHKTKPRFWDLKDLICHFENDNGFDYKVRVKIWEEMNGYEMKKSYDNILKLLTAIVEGNKK